MDGIMSDEVSSE